MLLSQETAVQLSLLSELIAWWGCKLVMYKTVVSENQKNILAKDVLFLVCVK